MILNEYLKTTVTLHLVFIFWSCGGIDGVYLYYDYPIDGDTARIICESNRGILPAVKSNNLPQKPHWVDNNKCKMSGCAVEVNGVCQSKSCKETQRLLCKVDSTCISKVKSHQNVSEMNSRNLKTEERNCEETCCRMENCLGISYENSTCQIYEVGTTEKEVFIKETTLKKMKYEEKVIPETISLCLTDILNTMTLSTGPSFTGSLQPTATYKLVTSIFRTKSSASLSTATFVGTTKGYISPTSTYVAGSSSVAFSTSVDETTNAVSVSSITQPTKPTLDLSSSLSPSFSSQCFCRCQGPTTSLTEEESKSKMSQLKEELTIPKKDLSSTYRKKTSIPDNRVSATSIGMVGVGIMCVVFGGIILMDLGMMASHIGILYKNVFGRCRS